MVADQRAQDMDAFDLMVIQLQGEAAPPLPALPGTHYRPLDAREHEDDAPHQPDADRGSEADPMRARGSL